MVDTVSALYGVFSLVLAYFIARIVDLTLGYFFDKSLFSKIWKKIVISFRKFQTRWHPIILNYKFRARFEPINPIEVKHNLELALQCLTQINKGRIQVSAIKWDEENKLGSLDITFNKREYKIDLQIDTEFSESLENIVTEKSTIEVSTGVSLNVSIDFQFKHLEAALFSLNTLMNFLREKLTENILQLKYSKGIFEIKPKKARLKLDDWIKEKKFEVSLNLKSTEQITINLYPEIAQVIFPSLQIDENVYTYLKAIILNYYF